MPFIYEFTNKLAYGSIQMANVMHVQCTDGGQADIPDLDATATRLALYYTQLSTFFPAAARWQAGNKVLEFEDSSPNVKTALGVTPAIMTAPSGTDPLPSSCAVCINWHTGLPGRSRRGRTFLGPLNSDLLSGGYLHSTYAAQAQSTSNGLLSGLVALSRSMTLVVWSKTLSQAFAISNATTDSSIDNLRSRKF